MMPANTFHQSEWRPREQSEISPKYRLTVEERPTYTYACIHSSDDRFRPTAVHLRQILERCGLPSCERIIIENRTRTAFHRGDFLQTATRFPGFGDVHTKVAIVDVHDAKRVNEGLTIVIGRNSSITVRVFPTLNDAENWLQASH